MPFIGGVIVVGGGRWAPVFVCSLSLTILRSHDLKPFLMYVVTLNDWVGARQFNQNSSSEIPSCLARSL